MNYQGQYKNLNDLFQKRVEKSSNHTALMEKVDGEWKKIKWIEYYEMVKNCGMGLKELGLIPKDKVIILSNTRIEWAIADMGIVGVCGVTVPIYQSNKPSECEYIINDSEAKYIFVEDREQLDKIMEIKNNIPTVKKIIVFSSEEIVEDNFIITLDTVYNMGKKFTLDQFKAVGSGIKRDTIASIIYTSGTTGLPKGSIISHRSLLANAEGLGEVLSDGIVENETTTLMFLPLAHIFAKIIHIFTIHKGIESAYAESIEKLVDNIGEVSPHLMGSVPRIYEKVYAKVIGDVEASNPVKKKIFYWALGIGREVSELIQQKKPIPKVLELKYKTANRLVFSKLSKKFGGRLRFFVSSGAPLSKEIAEFMHSAGILVLEAYGLTEVAGAATLNYPNNFKFGSVGPIMPSNEMKIAQDGEVLLRGPIVMDGYYKKEAETKEVIDKDGWFHTGDIGIIDDDGFLQITDRKKDIIVTAAGKNIAPQSIENLVKTDRHISQIIVLGDKQKYLVSLININVDEVRKYVSRKGIKVADGDENLISHPKVIEFIEEIISKFNETLPRYATIKKFKIVSNEFSIETGELTPTLKVKRSFCMKKYKDIIDSMY